MLMKIITAVLLLPGMVSVQAATVKTGKDAQALLPFWELTAPAMRLRLVQRLPDQTRAYFLARGFDKKTVGFIAGHCFFQSSYANTAKGNSKTVIEFDMRNWQIIYQGKTLSLLTRERWAGMSPINKAKPAQRIALQWSLLPDYQILHASDYNWGMTALPLPHGARFDLKLQWKRNGKPRQAIIRDIRCARDIYVAPPKE